MKKEDEKKTGFWNPERKGFETVDGGLIRICGTDDDVRIDLYGGNEREKLKHTKDVIRIDTNNKTAHIDSHNADKTEKESVDIKCYLTTACLKHMRENFTDDCEELTILRWFRDTFVTEEDKKHYYIAAPYIVEGIESIDDNNAIYEYIYRNYLCMC